jgi:hypothetical protein
VYLFFPSSCTVSDQQHLTGRHSHV